MCDYPFFIPQVVLFANSSLFWFKVTNEHREFRNYLLSFFIVIPAHPLPLEYTHYIILQILCQFSKTLYSSYDSFAYTATDGKKYNVDYYNLDVIISVGYRVKSHRGTQFRIWAMGIIKEYMKKGFALDDDRLKRLGGGNYFAELLARIRDIRSA